MNTRNLFNAAAFQGGWFACLLWLNTGAAIALPVGLGIHYWLISRNGAEWIVIVGGAMLGLSMDMAWQRLGLIEYNATIGGGFPPWLVVIWLLFMASLNHSLGWLQNRLPLAALLGTAAPLSYWAGIRLGAATPQIELWQLLTVMGVGWACLLPFLVFLMQSACQRERTAT